MANDTNNLLSRAFRRLFFDDDATAATARYISWQKMGERFVCILTFGAGTGLLTFKIFVATSSTGTDATVVLAHAAPTTADAANDQRVLEVSAEDCREVLRAAGISTDGKTLYVSAEVDNDDNADENAVYYEIHYNYVYEDLTADITA
jgi:hypothetical protein